MSRHPRADDNTEDGFLSRWSRRKSRVDQPEPAGEPGEVVPGRSEPADPAGDTEPIGNDSREPERVKTDDDMPDLDTINETSDMSDFFSPGVSEELRNQALRRLFRMAKFNVTDGLDDYAGDYRNFAPLGDIVTSDMRHRMERDRERQEELDELARGEEPPVSQQDMEPDAQEESPADAEETTMESPPAPEDDEFRGPDNSTAEAGDDKDDETRSKSNT